MKSLTPKQSLTRRSRQVQAFSFATFAIGLAVLAVGVLLTVIKLVPLASPSAGVYNAFATFMTFLGILGILVAIGLFIRAVTWKTDNDLAAVTGTTLSPQLPDTFVFIRNVSKREIGYVDAILIGLPGVLVFRIVANRGVLANEGGNWLAMNSKNEWMPARLNPTKECLADVDKVKEFLRERMKRDLPVFGIVVFAEDPSRVSLALKNNTVPVTHLTAIMTALQSQYLAANRMGIAEVNTASRLLFGEPI